MSRDEEADEINGTSPSQMQITKQTIVAEAHKLNAAWSTGNVGDWWPKEEKPIDISKLTREEQADLIIEKLRAPPKPRRTLEDELAETLATHIAAEIDKELMEILNTLIKGKL